jgi:hypothetical protein
MRFLSVADRELRSAARQNATYRARWLTAALFLALLVWLLWAFDGFTRKGTGPGIFKAFSILAFLYCLFVSAARTADCISVERRDGTLGLLFLTNLNSAEIIAGKFFSTALASVYGLMAIFPMLALPLLMGGITLGHFGRTVLGLLNGILFALAAGFLASVASKRQFTAVALALGLTLGLSAGPMLGAVAASTYSATRPLAPWLAALSPLYTVLAANNTGVFGPSHYWQSAATVAGMSLGGLGLTTLLLAGTWRDRPRTAHRWRPFRFWRRSEQNSSAARTAFRRRLLAVNPLFWLAARRRVSAPVFMVLAVVLTLLTVYVTAPFFGRNIGAGVYSPVVGHLFAWLWTVLAIHGLVLYYAAMSASQRLAEDKQTGALELIFSTPTTERSISRGLWLAYGRKMFFPALLAVLAHGFFIWQCMVMFTLDPPGQLSPGVTPGEIFWGVLFAQPVRGQALEWQFIFMMRIALLVLLVSTLTWPTLGWVGRWLGLRMKHPGFAPITSLVLLVGPPVLLFSLACYLVDKVQIYRLPQRRFLPLMMWLAVAIGIGHCVVLSVWAATRLRHQLRSVAMSRYQPLPAWRWRLPSRRAVFRVAIAIAVLAIGVPVLVVSYYGYQNWRSQRAWRAFQTALDQQKESLALAPLLPRPVPDSANLVRSPAFISLLSRTNHQTKDLFETLASFDVPTSSAPGGDVLLAWSHQTNAALRPFVGWTSQPTGGGPGTKRAEDAAAVLRELESHSELLRELAAAAARLPALLSSANRDARAVLHPLLEPMLTVERLHLLFQVRGCASLALGRNADAAEDVLAGLHLARLARQLPDVRSTVRVQWLLARSLQPIWEGLDQHAWTEPQLAAFQHELAGFNLLADYTNAVRRVVLAHIEVWRAIPDSPNPQKALLALSGYNLSEPVWQMQPRAWWFDSCIQLESAGRRTIAQVDLGSGRIQPENNWSELSGLPLDFTSMELLQQSLWWGASPASVAFAQTSVNQAVLACALERFRLLNGVYPESLDKLLPAFLDRVPHDAISGWRMIYQPGGPSSFILRGVGPNGTDDRKNPTSDDWLWTYPTNTPSANK